MMMMMMMMMMMITSINCWTDALNKMQEVFKLPYTRARILTHKILLYFTLSLQLTQQTPDVQFTISSSDPESKHCYSGEIVGVKTCYHTLWYNVLHTWHEADLYDRSQTQWTAGNKQKEKKEAYHISCRHAMSTRDDRWNKDKDSSFTNCQTCNLYSTHSQLCLRHELHLIYNSTSVTGYWMHGFISTYQ